MQISNNILYFVEKRTPALQQNATAPTSQIQELKASPPAKKSVPKRTPSLTGSPQAHVKSPFKGGFSHNKMKIFKNPMAISLEKMKSTTSDCLVK